MPGLYFRVFPQNLYLNTGPFPLTETNGSKEITGDLISEYSQPDTDDAKAQGISKEKGDTGTDQSYADSGGNSGIEGITGTPQTAHIDHLADLEDNNQNDHMHDLYPNGDNVLLSEKQAEKPMCAKEVDEYQKCRDGEAKHFAGATVFLGQFLIFLAKTPADQSHSGGLQPVTKGEGKPHNVHAHLMCSHGIRPLVSGHNGSHHKTHTHQKLFKEYAVPYLYETEEGSGSRAYFVLEDIGHTDKAFGMQNGNKAHDAGDNRTEYGSQCSTGDTQSGKTEMPLNQQIIKYNVDGVGGHIGAHGYFCVAGAALCRIDSHLDTVKNHAAHDDPKIGGCILMCISSGTTDTHNGRS